MPQFKIPLPGGGDITVNAADEGAARGNVPGGGGGGGGGSPAPSAAPSAVATPAQVAARVYNTVNGPKTEQQMQQELLGVGWGGPTATDNVFTAYARTTNGGVSPAATPSAATGPSAYDQAILDAFKEGSGINRDKLAEEKRQFDLQQQATRDQMERIGLPELAIKQRLAQLEDAKFQATIAQTAAQLAATDPFAYSNYRRGVQGLATGVPRFVQALNENARMPDYQAPGSLPPPITLQGVAQRLGQTGTPGVTGAATPLPGVTGDGQSYAGYNADQTLRQIDTIGARGAANLGLGALEQLTPDELNAFGLGLAHAGYNGPAFVRDYFASRPKQTALSGGTRVAY